MTNQQIIKKIAIQVFELESEAILDLIQRIDDSFYTAVELIKKTQGKIIVTGIGKSGHIARKMASTLTSTGTSALFLHPAESNHGDLGVIDQKDLVIAISYGGEASELSSIISFVKRHDINLIAVTGKKESTLAKAATVALDVSVKKEACPLNLAPTTSSTATLALCDAIAMSILELKGFDKNHFAEFHPGGSLGLRLRKIKDVMKTEEEIPFLKAKTSMKEILAHMTRSSVRGAAGIVNEENNLIGIITDGDIRRFLEKSENPFLATADQIMSRNPKTISIHSVVDQAMQMMEKNKIQVLIVVDSESKNPLTPLGAVVYQKLVIK